MFTRLLRADMVLTLQSDFITLASAKGVPPRRVLWRHALRNSLFSLLTSDRRPARRADRRRDRRREVLRPRRAWARMLVTSILAKDLFTVQASVALLVVTVVVVNLVVDLLYAVIDPRIRQARALG